jgi:hypothetical protein
MALWLEERVTSHNAMRSMTLKEKILDVFRQCFDNNEIPYDQEDEQVCINDLEKLEQRTVAKGGCCEKK